MSNNTAPLTASASGLRLADLRDDQILGMIERAASDPFIANEVLHLQKQACESMSRAVQDMLNELSVIDPVTDALPKGPMTVVALASAARQREVNAKQKRELAESLIVSALINRDNADWDVFDPTSSANPVGNGLLALLQMQLPSPKTGT